MTPLPHAAAPPLRPFRCIRRLTRVLAGLVVTTPLAWGAESAPVAPRGFGTLDWIVLIAYATVLLGVGFHFSRRQRTTEEYFMGGRRMNPILAGISVFAAYFSIVSYIATPGEYVRYGPTLILLAPLVALPIVYLIVGWLIIPVVMRLPITSAFELLEGRLGRPIRQACSFTYVLVRLIWMGLILYVSATMLVRVLDCDPRWSYLIAIIVGSITTTYTLIGGIRTVMVTEAIQSCMLLGGAILTIVLISIDLGGVTAWFPRHWEPHWPVQPFFATNLHVRVTQLGAFVFMLIGGICYTVTDQSAVQRLLTTRDAVAARRAYFLSNVVIVLMRVLLTLVGAALLAFYRLHPDPSASHLTVERNGDAFFPYYISHYLPHGISGLIVAGLLAAAMSCLSGGLNSTTTVITKDFIDIWSRQDRSDLVRMRTTRMLVLILGITAILASIGMGSISGNLVEVASKTVDLLLCPSFGLFFLAIFIKYATPFGAAFGALYSTTAAIVIGYWDVLTGQPKISFIWIMPIPFAISLAGGCLFSLLPTRGRSPAVVAAYTIAVAIPLLVGVSWLLMHFRT